MVYYVVYHLVWYTNHKSRKTFCWKNLVAKCFGYYMYTKRGSAVATCILGTQECDQTRHSQVAKGTKVLAPFVYLSLLRVRDQNVWQRSFSTQQDLSL